ncbi:hypothetical protein Ancab_033412 [Ancistrocladus abbreviatus]
MTKIPINFERVAAAFNELAWQPRPPCESSGSEHWVEESGEEDLSDLVNSFIEKGERDVEDADAGEISNEEDDEIEKERDDDHKWDVDRKELLLRLLGGTVDGDGGGGGGMEERIHEAVEVGCRVIGECSSRSDFKRRLVAYLRDNRYDSGLCKSRWEKTGPRLAGDYDYIDVNLAGTRYIVELFLAGEFQIARPTTRYNSLLAMLPPIFVGKPEVLKQIVRLMTAAVKESLKSVHLHVPPWRRNGYMQAKWFASYKRTVNPIPGNKAGDEEGSPPAKKRSVGFEARRRPPPPVISFHCRDDFGKAVLRVGLLAAAFQEK